MKAIDIKLEKASKAYADNIILRGLVNLIPSIGGTLDIIFCEKWNDITQKRIENFIQNTKEEFENIDEKIINKEFLFSDDFADLTVKCLTSSTKTRHQEKIKFFASILKNAATSQEFNLDEFEEMLPIFEQLSSRELVVLTHLDNWELNLLNKYEKMLNYSEVRKSYAPGLPAGIPVYLSFWDAFLDEVHKKSTLQIEDIEYLLMTSSQKGLFVFENYNVSKDNVFAARESFQHTMKGKLTPLFKRMKKFVFNRHLIVLFNKSV